jgi:hypothetical protein
LSDWTVDPVADRVQLPGPSGTSTDSKPGSSVPESSPLIALTLDVDATGRSVEVVTLKEPLAGDDGVLVVFAVTITGVGVVVGVVGPGGLVGVDDVVEFGCRVVTGDVEEGGRDEASGARGEDVALSVKTSTRSRSGLDHIKRWALFSEKGERGIVFVG